MPVQAFYVTDDANDTADRSFGWTITGDFPPATIEVHLPPDPNGRVVLSLDSLQTVNQISLTWPDERSFSTHLRSPALPEGEDFAAIYARWNTSSVPLGSGGGIGFSFIAAGGVKMYIDGLPGPGETGPFRGRVAGFSENLSQNSDFRWHFEAVARRVSPGNTMFMVAGNQDNSVWDTDAQVIIGDIPQNRFSYHKTSIVDAVQAGKTAIVNHQTYLGILDELGLAAEDSLQFDITNPIGGYLHTNGWRSAGPFDVHYTDVAGGRLIDGSFAGSDWSLGWSYRQPFLTLAPINQYRDLSIAFNALATPEPATISLLALGGLAILRRRKK